MVYKTPSPPQVQDQVQARFSIKHHALPDHNPPLPPLRLPLPNPRHDLRLLRRRPLRLSIPKPYDILAERRTLPIPSATLDESSQESENALVQSCR